MKMFNLSFTDEKNNSKFILFPEASDYAKLSLIGHIWQSVEDKTIELKYKF